MGEEEGSDNFIAEEQVPEGLRFPAMFRGQGGRDHRYHVFDEPRYVLCISSSLFDALLIIDIGTLRKEIERQLAGGRGKVEGMRKDWFHVCII